MDAPATPDLGASGAKRLFAVAHGSAHSLALQAYRDLMTEGMPSNPTDYRRAIMLAVLIGREIEAAYAPNDEAHTLRPEVGAVTRNPEQKY